MKYKHINIQTNWTFKWTLGDCLGAKFECQYENLVPVEKVDNFLKEIQDPTFSQEFWTIWHFGYFFLCFKLEELWGVLIENLVNLRISCIKIVFKQGSEIYWRYRYGETNCSFIYREEIL